MSNFTDSTNTKPKFDGNNLGNLASQFQQAEAYEEVGAFNEANTVYKNIIAENPNNAKAYLALGFVLVKQNKFTQALEMWEKATDIKSNIFKTYISTENAFLYKSKIDQTIAAFSDQMRRSKESAYSHHNLGMVYKYLHRYELALQCFKTAEGINPNMWESYLHCGETYQLLNQPKLAMEQYKFAVQANQTSAKPAMKLAELYLKENMTGLAMKQIDNAISIDPNNGRAYFILGKIHFNQANFKMAMLNYQKSLDRSPEDPVVHYHLAKACEAMYRLDFAISELKRAIQLDPDYAEAYYTLGSLQSTTGDVVNATESFKKAVELNPSDAYANYQLGLTYFKQNRYRDSIPPLKEAVRLNAMDSYAYYILSQSYLQLKNLEEATTYMSEAIKLKSDDPAYYAQKGFIEMVRGEMNAAEQDYRKAIELKPSDTEYRVSLATLLLRKGRPDLIIEEMENFLQYQTPNADIYIQMAEAYFALEDLVAANVSIDKALENNPNNPKAIHFKGLILLQNNRLEEAIDQFHDALKLDPEFIPAICDAADMDIVMGDGSNGLKSYLELIAKASPENEEELKARYGRALFAAGNVDSGIQQFKALIAKNGNSAELHFKFAKAYLEVGNVNSAIEELKIAIDSGATDPDYGLLLGKLYLSQNDKDRAKDVFYTILKNYPTHSATQQALKDLFKSSIDSTELFIEAPMGELLSRKQLIEQKSASLKAAPMPKEEAKEEPKEEPKEELTEETKLEPKTQELEEETPFAMPELSLDDLAELESSAEPEESEEEDIEELPYFKDEELPSFDEDFQDELEEEETPAEPVTESKVEPIAESVAESKVEPIAESVAESKAEPIAESVAESKAEPIAESVAESKAEPIAEPVEKSEPEEPEIVTPFETDEPAAIKVESQSLFDQAINQSVIDLPENKNSKLPSLDELLNEINEKSSSRPEIQAIEPNSTVEHIIEADKELSEHSIVSALNNSTLSDWVPTEKSAIAAATISTFDIKPLDVSGELKSVDLGEYFAPKGKKPELDLTEPEPSKPTAEQGADTIDDIKETKPSVVVPQAKSEPSSGGIKLSQLSIDLESELDTLDDIDKYELIPAQHESEVDLDPTESWYLSKIKDLKNSASTSEIDSIIKVISEHTPPCPAKYIEALAQELINVGRKTHAIEECKRSIEAESESLETQLLLGKIFTMVESYSMASLHYQRLTRKYKDPIVNLLLAECYVNMNNLKAARKAYGKYLDKEPNDINTFLKYAAILGADDIEKETERALSLLSNPHVTKDQMIKLRAIFKLDEYDGIEEIPDLEV